MNVNSETCSPVLCVHYPGVVKNVSKMLETLGGIRMISSVYAEKNRRLELRFRPDDAFCKPLFASRKPAAALILKIKVKKSKQEVISCEPVGYVTEEYKFCNLCDFQFLPTSKDECLYDSIVPKGLDTEWLKGEAPFFLPPAAFSRVDSVQSFNFSKSPVEEDKPKVIGRLRRKRFGCTKCLTFDNPEVPLAPKDVPLTGLCSTKMFTSETLNQLKELFQDRPIYSKCAIKCISGLPLVQLKCLLPCVAYYFANGPWRSLWVRFGYDPRKDPSSRIFQTLDYRVRSHLSKEEVKIKKGSSGGSLSFKFSNQVGKTTSVIKRNPTEVSDKEEKCEDDYIFKPEMIPTSRQRYYQYCDIHIPEIKAMLENMPPVEDDAVCHELDGWMPPSMADTCRDIMNHYVSEEVKRRNKLTSQAINSVTVENQSSFFSGSGSESEESGSDSEQT